MNGRVGGWSSGSNKRRTAKAGFSPLSGRKAHHRRKEAMSLRTVVGVVKVVVWHGKDPTDKRWGCPIRERWGLRAHQQMSPALEEKLAFTATLTLSYEGAAKVASKWGCEADDSVIHSLVQRLGNKAEGQMQERLRQLPQESEPGRQPSEVGI